MKTQEINRRWFDELRKMVTGELFLDFTVSVGDRVYVKSEGVAMWVVIESVEETDFDSWKTVARVDSPELVYGKRV